MLTIHKTKTEILKFSVNPWKSNQDTCHFTGCPVESWKLLELWLTERKKQSEKVLKFFSSLNVIGES